MPENENRIGFLNHKPSGCFWYRIKQPMEMLATNGTPTEMISINQDIEYGKFKSFQFYGAYPFSCEKVFQFLKAEGKGIVYDMDDALDLIDQSNPWYFNVKKDLGSVNMALDYADEITVSTEAMKQYVRTKTNKPITVIPNCYTPSEWTFPRPNRGGTRIGFAGSATHVKDLIEIIPVISALQKKHDITFLIMGFGKESYQEWYRDFRYIASPEAIKNLEDLDKRLATINFEWVPYVDYTIYPSTLINMALDIGICPLKETPFDRCRSACKAMEYTLSGSLALASDTEPYRNDLNSFKVGDSEWESALEAFIVNPAYRKELQQSYLKWTQENRNVNTQLETLKKVYGV